MLINKLTAKRPAKTFVKQAKYEVVRGYGVQPRDCEFCHHEHETEEEQALCELANKREEG